MDAKEIIARRVALEVEPDTLVNLGIGLAQTTAVNTFTRGQEEDADNTGFNYLAAAGYNVAKGAQSFAVLRRLYGERDPATNYVFSSHPLSSERQARLTRLARQAGADQGRVAAAEYLRKTNPIRREVFQYLESVGRDREAAQARRNMQRARR